MDDPSTAIPLQERHESQATITALQSELRDARERLARVDLLVEDWRERGEFYPAFVPGEDASLISGMFRIQADELRTVLDAESVYDPRMDEAIATLRAILDEQSGTIPGDETRAQA